MEWLRYEMEGLNHWWIDEKYDGDDPADGIDAEDPFRIQRYYVNGPGQLGQIVKAAVYDYSGEEPVSTDYYYGYDVLGNVSVISNANGAEADQFEQDAFGNDVLENGNWTWENPVAGITEHLTTKQYDADLGPNGLYYFNARWYDPVTGAFLAPDLVSSCNSINGSRKWLEPYIFCSNDPVQYVDPSGYDPLKKDKYDIHWLFNIDISGDCLCQLFPNFNFKTKKEYDLLARSIGWVLRDAYRRWVTLWEYKSEFRNQVDCMGRSRPAEPRLQIKCKKCGPKTCALASENVITVCSNNYEMPSVTSVNSVRTNDEAAPILKALGETLLHELGHTCGWGGKPGSFQPKHPLAEPWYNLTCSVDKCTTRAEAQQMPGKCED